MVLSLSKTTGTKYSGKPSGTSNTRDSEISLSALSLSKITRSLCSESFNSKPPKTNFMVYQKLLRRQQNCMLEYYFERNKITLIGYRGISHYNTLSFEHKLFL